MRVYNTYILNKKGGKGKFVIFGITYENSFGLTSNLVTLL